jgi:hypothetical protein
MSTELKKALKELVKYLEESNAPLEIRNKGYKALGIVELLTDTPPKTPSIFDTARMFKGKDIPKYALFYEKYGPFSQSIPIILGNLALSPKTCEDISKSTGMDKDFVLEMLDTLMYEGFVDVQPNKYKARPIRYTLPPKK